MIERYVAPALTFSVLIAGHLAIAMAMFSGPVVQTTEPVAQAPVIQLDTVIVTAKRVS